MSMTVITADQPVPSALRGAVAALGNFDGFHLGHQEVVGRAAAMAEQLSAPLAVVTFDPHPALLFKPDVPCFALTTVPQKLALLEEFGVDLVVVLPFDATLANETAEGFVANILVNRLGLRGAVTGYDFTFGKGRSGTTTKLQELGAVSGVRVETVPALSVPGASPVSSTTIREQLKAGAPHVAATLLGHWWRIAGTVSHGDKRGRTIGFPTANIPLGSYVRPKFGVYAVRAVGLDGAMLEGVANIGRRPTVAGTEERLEVHLFDFDGDIYGRDIEIEIVEFIRAEQKFSGLDALRAQIAVDCATAQKILRQPTFAHARHRLATRKAFETVMVK
jgi:riboflavin kinase / FMN adenylyltransferase